MRVDEQKHYIEAIKLAAGSVQYKELSVTETFHNAIARLYDYYCATNCNNYLEVALLHIQAYLEMGFTYESGGEIFDKILSLLDTSREIVFHQRIYSSRQIKVNKTQIKSMIRRWPASKKQQLKVDEVVTDIITKLKTKESGIFHYKCEVTTDLYELVINDSEVFFHDFVRGVFYTFLD